ncbi:hypothetical protein B9Z19DRAFT_1130733 [Tuber borchii]|uniref:Uncharacterized protein n=1 Tax=Tuber borchii TaxID=42251 RepID=A0A2T6ZJY4_TUBBO|nr:hypothetical protein B9Z19DRAFT_1130733 [Tuber borchii]
MDRQLDPASDEQKGGIPGVHLNCHEDAWSLHLKARAAEENTFKKPIKYNGTSDAVRAKVAEEKRRLCEANRHLLRDKANHETLATELKGTIANLSHQLEESERIRDAQMGELKRFQTQEYERSRGIARESHEAISSQFQEIFRRCSDWARDYFNIKIVDFHISKFPEFKRELEEVSWDNSDWSSKELFKASHLVQAVLGNMICREIFSSPFWGTPLDFHRQFEDMYWMKNRIDRAEAQRWRASSLQTLHSCTRWPFSGQEFYRLKSCKEQLATDIVRNIEEVLRPITTAHYPSLSTRELSAQSTRLHGIVKHAQALGEKMSMQSSKLEIFSKSWFNNTNRLFIANDSRVKSRLGDEDYDPQDLLRVDLVLSPGFLKYGNDNAENIDDWSVWTPAIVEIYDPARPSPPPPSRPHTAPSRTPRAFSSRDSEELPREMQKKEVASLSTTTEQGHHEDEEFEEVL